jgi:hypothetical protein
MDDGGLKRGGGGMNEENVETVEVEVPVPYALAVACPKTTDEMLQITVSARRVDENGEELQVPNEEKVVNVFWWTAHGLTLDQAK